MPSARRQLLQHTSKVLHNISGTGRIPLLLFKPNLLAQSAVGPLEMFEHKTVMFDMNLYAVYISSILALLDCTNHVHCST